mmetsp:Transcript_25493/g.71771  ORF Transcript_25493/g.71771 Transcript_25493/m.71771 type:complete len:203 (+) Transcript_25493:54-662(+)
MQKAELNSEAVPPTLRSIMHQRVAACIPHPRMFLHELGELVRVARVQGLRGQRGVALPSHWRQRLLGGELHNGRRRGARHCGHHLGVRPVLQHRSLAVLPCRKGRRQAAVLYSRVVGQHASLVEGRGGVDAGLRGQDPSLDEPCRPLVWLTPVVQRLFRQTRRAADLRLRRCRGWCSRRERGHRSQWGGARRQAGCRGSDAR